MRIFITGIAGFLGSYLRDALTLEGHEVIGNDSGICNSIDINPFEKVDCVDLSDMRSMIRTHGTEVLIHCAATAHEGLSSFSPAFITQNIYEASVATFSAAIASGVKRIIYMSSMARYGQQELPFIESMTPKPVDPYGIAKVAAEDTLKVLAKTHGIEYVIGVPHNIIGPRQRYWDPYRNVASIMINRSLRGEPIVVYGDGAQVRCFSPIKDCLHSLVKMIDAPIAGETINIGPDSGRISILELAHKIMRLTGSSLPITHFPDRPNEVKQAYCSSRKAKNLLYYRPQQDIDECLFEMVAYIKEHGTRDFSYSFPIEIVSDKTPKTWLEKLI